MTTIMLRSEWAGVAVRKRDERAAAKIVKKHGGKVLTVFDKGAEFDFQYPQSFRAEMRAAKLDYLIDDFK